MEKKKRVVVVIIIILVAIAGYGLLTIYRSEEAKKIIMDDELEDILYFEEGTEEGYACKIGGGYNNFIWDKYYCLRHYKYEKSKGGSKLYIEEVDYARLEFYDLTTKERVGKIDLKKSLKPYWEQYGGLITWSVNVLDFYVSESGELYVALWFKTRMDRWNYWALVNINTGEVLEPEQGRDSLWQETEVDQTDAYLKETFIFEEIGLLKSNGLSEEKIFEVTSGSSTRFIVLDSSMLPNENQRLYGLFPGLKEYKDTDGLTVYIMMKEFPTMEEVLLMILEEGQEISFEGCVLPAELSIDGKEHEIDSFEDYYQWRK